jgi:hypothetical protein
MSLDKIPPIDCIEDDQLLVHPDQFWKILKFEGRYIPRLMHSVTYAIRENAQGPIWSVRDFHHHADAEAFGHLVREAGGLANPPEENRV